MSGWEKTAITLAVFLPVAGAVVIAMVPKDKDRLVRALGILFTGAALVVAIVMLFGFDFGNHTGLQFELNVNWINVINAHYHVGIDGISLPLFELTFLLSFLCAVYTYKILPKPGRPKAFLALMLLLETGMAGTFIAFDLILFFVFWELVLVPMYFMIAVWGSACSLPLTTARIEVSSPTRTSGSCVPSPSRPRPRWHSSEASKPTDSAQPLPPPMPSALAGRASCTTRRCRRWVV